LLAIAHFSQPFSIIDFIIAVYGLSFISKQTKIISNTTF